MVVQDSGVASVMASYNEVNGTKSTEQRSTHLTEVLRNDFGFKGFVLSDWWADAGRRQDPRHQHADEPAITALNAGLDVELPWALNYNNLQSLYNIGRRDEVQLDAATRRILYEKYRFQVRHAHGKRRAQATGHEFTTRTRARSTAMRPTWRWRNARRWRAWSSSRTTGVLPISPSVTASAVVGATVPYSLSATATPTGSVNFAMDVRTATSDRAASTPTRPSRSVPSPDFASPRGARSSGRTASRAGPTADGSRADRNQLCGGSVNVTTATNNQGDLSAVMNAVGAADFVVVVAGLTPQDEGEEYTYAAD